MNHESLIFDFPVRSQAVVGCHTIETCRFFLPTKKHRCGGVLNKKHPVAVGVLKNKTGFKHFIFSTLHWGKIPILTSIVFTWVNQPINHQLENTPLGWAGKWSFMWKPSLQYRQGWFAQGVMEWGRGIGKNTPPVRKFRFLMKKNGLGRSLASLHLSGGMTYICLVNIWVHVFETQPACLGKDWLS